MSVKIADVIVPSIFRQYVIERTAALTAFIGAGVIARANEFDALVQTDGSKTIDMPFWQDLTGDDEVVTDNGSLTPGGISTSKDVARKIVRARAWQSNDLVPLLAGDDPMRAIGDLVAGYWARRMQVAAISLTKGIFGASSLASNTLDIYKSSGSIGAANVLSGLTTVDAAQKLGDAKSKLSAIAMHSAVEADLLKQDLIDFVPDSEGKYRLKMFQGLRVIVDDGLPTETVDGATVYHTIYFGDGAIAWGEDGRSKSAEGAAGGDWYSEIYREALAGETGLITRRHFILHPRGVKWTENSVAAHYPTNAELETASNWQRVYEAKNVRIVRLRHNIGAAA